MARILGQLACGACGDRFWPRRGESAALVVLCPQCSAAHANPDALPAGPLSTSNRILDGWLRTYWIDGAPRTGAAGIGQLLWTRKPWITYGPLSHIDGCRITKHGPLHAALAHCTYYHRVRGMPVYPQSWTTIFIAAYLPRPDLLADIEGVFAMRGGVAFIETDGNALARAGGLAYELVRRGAEPLFELAQVPDPTPLSDEPAELVHDGGAPTRVEAERVRCARCGAPSAVAGLIGEDARCPYCGAPQAIPAGLAAELAVHRRRVRAAQLGPKTLLDLTSAWAQPVARAATPEQASIACAHCGALAAPGVSGGSCASCRAPIVPSGRAMRRAEAIEADVTAQKHGRHAMRASAQHFSSFRSEAGLVQLFSENVIPAVALASAFFLLFMFFASLSGMIGSMGSSSGASSEAVASLATLGGVGLFLVIFALVYARWSGARRRKAAAQWLAPVVALADQLGATHGSAHALVAWVTNGCNDRLAPAWHATSARRVVLTFQSAGFPLAITLDPQGSTGIDFGHARAHVDLALAAELPRDVVYRVRQPDARRIVDELARIGFTLDLRTGGLALFASVPLVRHFAEHSERLALMAPITTALTQLAHRLGAEPPRAQAAPPS